MREWKHKAAEDGTGRHRPLREVPAIVDSIIMVVRKVRRQKCSRIKTGMQGIYFIIVPDVGSFMSLGQVSINQ